MNKLKAFWDKVKGPLWHAWKFSLQVLLLWLALCAVTTENTALAIITAMFFVWEVLLPELKKPAIELNTYNYFNIDETLAKAFKEQAEANCPDKVEPKAEA